MQSFFFLHWVMFLVPQTMLKLQYVYTSEVRRACVREEQLRPREAERHPQEVAEAPRPVDVHAAQVLLLRVGVEAHGAKETRETKQVISVQVGDENLGDPTWEENTTLHYTQLDWSLK